jgi:hypothetical protein
VVRKDADGGKMTFKLADIGTITTDADSQAHVLLACKAGAACIERVDAPGVSKRSMNMVAFSIDSLQMGNSVLRLFQELQALVVKPRS